MKCANCGWQLTGDAIFCHHCGRAIKATNSKRNKSGGGLKIAVIVLSAVLAVCIAVSAILFATLFAGDKNGSDKTRDFASDTEAMNKTDGAEIESKTPDKGITPSETSEYDALPEQDAQPIPKKISTMAYDESDVISYVHVSKAVDAKYEADIYDWQNMGMCEMELNDSELGVVWCKSVLVEGFDESEDVSDCTGITYCYSDNSAVYRISAAYNLGGITPASLCNEMKLTYPGEVTYNPVRDEWFAISTNDGKIYRYAYYRVNDSRIVGFEFHFYGKENLDRYSKYIDEIFAMFEYDKMQ